ncbi:MULTISPECIES: DUF4374 domain-containing protein [Flavobacterium]|jgi:hypothetical protein|uniref:DUF4374 domain-containing protein n=1 Tax=Flavobacterium TaxID=237 RepID=UPI00036A8E24|nr:MULTISPECIES: DUF4374 domain-containing protein [Flavobacterium]MDL2141438.1 DUF4374 domain-containing protein [Flavobacterium tructae]URC14210.1 DUF4374 domain-containing protein [Flavobacterium sp. B183]
MFVNKFAKCFALAFLSCSIFSCSSDDSSKDETPTVNGTKYVASYWLADYTQYILDFNSTDQLMTGEISAKGVGIEQGGSCFPVNNTFFALSTEDEGSVSFRLNNSGKLGAGDKISFESSYAVGYTDDKKLINIGATWDGSSSDYELMIYNPATVSIDARKFNDFSVNPANKKILYWPTGAAVSGDKLFVPVYTKDVSDGTNKVLSSDATMRVYKYPSLEYVSTIKDARTTAIGLYYTNTGIVQTESGDIYTFSSNARAGGYPVTGVSSGVLRVRKGDAKFDPGYFFDLQSSTLKGKVLAAYPLGGEKVFISYIPTEVDAANSVYSFLNTKTIFKSAILDLSAKTILAVTGLPDHGGDEFFGLGSMFVENGKAYKSFVTGDQARVYQIDIATGTAKAGALIKEGLYLPSIGKLTY